MNLDRQKVNNIKYKIKIRIEIIKIIIIYLQNKKNKIK
jgi:hypothetical protein